MLYCLCSISQEGTIEYEGYRTWYRVLGRAKPVKKKRRARPLPGTADPGPEKLPLLVLHGGPGTPSRCVVPCAMCHVPWGPGSKVGAVAWGWGPGRDCQLARVRACKHRLPCNTHTAPLCPLAQVPGEP